VSRLGAIDTRGPVETAPISTEGLYSSVCVFILVFLCTLPLTAVPDEAFAGRLAGFVVTGVAAGWMSANGGAALLGLAAGHVTVLLIPEWAPAAMGARAYAALAVAILGAGMWAGRVLRARRAPRPADGAPFLVPGRLVCMAGIAAGLFPFAFARPHPEGAFWALGLPLGFVVVVLLGVLSPEDPKRAWGWFLLGHSPFLLLAFFALVIPALVILAVTWFGIWWGSVIAADSLGIAPRPAAAAPAPATGRRDPGGRMG
jgi:hypothetical protein